MRRAARHPRHAGLRSVAVRFPDRVVENDHWHREHPEMVARLEELALAQTWSPRGSTAATVGFDAAMAPFLRDPFRGSRARRWFRTDDEQLELEAETALGALEAARLGLGDVDVLIVGSFPPPRIDVGNGTYLAARLGLSCPAWNLESACASTLLALQTAVALVESGQARNVLVVNSCAYSRYAPSEESVSLANGDGASAMVVGERPEPGLLGAFAVNTGSTCDALNFELDRGRNGDPAIRMRIQKGGGLKIREATEGAFRTCVDGALESAGLELADIDFFAFNAATAWLVPFYSSLLGIGEERSIDTHTTFANTGPVLVPTSLFYGAHAGRIPEGGRVLMFGIGNAANAVALVFSWTGVGLAPVQVPL